VAQRRLAEGVLPHAVGGQASEVDVGKGELRRVGEAPGLGGQGAVLVDDRVAVPGEVGGRLAEARGAVEVGREAARRLVGDELVAVALLADDDVRRREVRHHGGAGEGRE
jgi:hypothetical protein